MKFDDGICKGVSCPECSFNKGEDGCLLAKRLDEIEIIPEPCDDAVSRKAVEGMLQNGFPARGMWEIEGDVVKQTVCETLADALMDLEKLPSVTPKQRWILCSERLPEKHGELYLVTISDGSVYSFALQWDINRKRWYLSFLNNGEILIDYVDDVIAWMPLPEPYREEGGE